LFFSTTNPLLQETATSKDTCDSGLTEEQAKIAKSIIPWPGKDFLLFPLLILTLENIKYLDRYTCSSSTWKAQACNPRRNSISMDNGYSEPNKYIKQNMKLFQTKERGIGVIWTGKEPLPPSTLLSWYFGDIIFVTSEDQLPKDSS
jgi:hypothetical protein